MARHAAKTVASFRTALVVLSAFLTELLAESKSHVVKKKAAKVLATTLGTAAVAVEVAAVIATGGAALPVVIATSVLGGSSFVTAVATSAVSKLRVEKKLKEKLECLLKAYREKREELLEEVHMIATLSSDKVLDILAEYDVFEIVEPSVHTLEEVGDIKRGLYNFLEGRIHVQRTPALPRTHIEWISLKVESLSAKFGFVKATPRYCRIFLA